MKFEKPQTKLLNMWARKNPRWKLFQQKNKDSEMNINTTSDPSNLLAETMELENPKTKEYAERNLTTPKKLAASSKQIKVQQVSNQGMKVKEEDRRS